MPSATVTSGGPKLFTMPFLPLSLNRLCSNHSLAVGLLFASLLCFSITLEAQRAQGPGKIDWGNEYREPSNTRIGKIVSSNELGVYVYREKLTTAFSLADKVYLERYDMDMKLAKSKEYDLKYKSKTRDFEEILMLDRQLYFLTSFNNQAHKKNYLFVQEIDNDRLTLDRRIDMIAETEAVSKNREGSFAFTSSPDSTKLLVYNQLPYVKRNPERFALRVFGSGFQPLWDREITLPYSDDEFSIEEYRIDNEGNVYLLGIFYADRNRLERANNPTYQYRILAYRKDGAEVQEYPLDLRGRFITDLTFRIGRDGNLVCSGFYSEKNSYSVKGTYFIRIDTETEEVISQNLKEFELEFLTAMLSSRMKEKAERAELRGNPEKEAELYRYSLDELVLRSDGGALLVAEQYYIYERNFQNFNGMWVTTYYYNYNDIIVINISPSGEIEWTARIPKRQVTVDDGGYFSSYAMSIVRDRIYFIYNDNPRNLEQDRPMNRLHNFNGSNSVIALSEVMRDGSVNTYPLFINREASIITRPKICKQISRNSIAVYGERGRNYRFGRLDF